MRCVSSPRPLCDRARCCIACTSQWGAARSRDRFSVIFSVPLSAGRPPPAPPSTLLVPSLLRGRQPRQHRLRSAFTAGIAFRGSSRPRRVLGTLHLCDCGGCTKHRTLGGRSVRFYCYSASAPAHLRGGTHGRPPAALERTMSGQRSVSAHAEATAESSSAAAGCSLREAPPRRPQRAPRGAGGGGAAEDRLLCFCWGRGEDGYVVPRSRDV